IERVPLFNLIEPLRGTLGVLFREFTSQKSATKLLGDGQGCSAAGERVEHQVTRVGAYANNPSQELLRHLTPMESLPLLEGSGDAGKVPGVVERAEAIGIRLEILWPKNPGVVGEPSLGIRSLVS